MMTSSMNDVFIFSYDDVNCAPVTFVCFFLLSQFSWFSTDFKNLTGPKYRENDLYTDRPKSNMSYSE